MVGGTSNMGPPAVTPRKAPTTPSSKNALALGVTPHKTPLRTPGGSKIEQTSSTPIIDFRAIESQKENVQPLAKGRSAHALSNTLGMQHKQRQALLAQQRAEHESTVTSADNADSDDPLDAWTKYVKWCIDNYPSGQTHDSGLIPLLERATRHFKDSEQYTNDPRYLRLWILYARNVECARDVYNFLLANEIGTKLASLYEELAVVLEGQRMYDEADAMYKLGIARRANPIDRIKRRYEEYKTRIILGHQSSVDAPGSSAAGLVVHYADALKAAMVTAGRSMLGQKEAAPGPARSHAVNVLRGAGATIGAIGNSTPTPSTNNGRRLNVFHDDDDRAPASSSRPHASSTKGWEDIGTVASRNQENVQADRLAGAKSFKIGASGGVSKKPGSGLAVFRDSDDDNDDDDEASQVPATPKPEGVLSPKDHFAKHAAGLGRKQASRETDLLRSDPFAYWDKDAKRVPDPASLRPDSDSAPASRKVSSSSSGSHGERHRTKTTVSRSTQASSSSSKPSAQASAAPSAGTKREKHAAPVADMYPSFRSDAQQALYTRNGWQSELTLEELMARARGFPVLVEGWEPAASLKSASDPWTHLDQLAGQWLPKDAPKTTSSRRADPEPTETAQIDQTTGMFPSRDVFDPDNSVANAVALNLRPGLKKKKRRDGDNTTKTRMSPTLVTKATLLEVENMFNGQDSDSDEDSSEDDDDDEEDDDYLAPLSSVSRPAHMRVSLGSAADVPPTPTPSSRPHLLAKFAGQHDENAGVRATPSRTPGAQAPRLGLGGATPMRTPLASKTAAPAPLGAKPVYREEDEEEDEYDENIELRATAEQPQPSVPQQFVEASSPPRPAAASAADADLDAPVPATPMPSSRQSASRRWVEPMAEEEEEEDDEEQYAVDENGEPIDGNLDAADGFEGNDHLFRPQFQPLTPITEATYEFTRYTNGRTPGTATRSAIGPALKAWHATEQDEDDDEDDEDERDDGNGGARVILTSGPIAPRGAAPVDDANLGDDSQGASDERSFASTSGEDANRSAWTAANKASFELTKGLTIRVPAGEEGDESEGDFDESLVIQDRATTDEQAPEQLEEPAPKDAGFCPPNPCSPVDPDVLNAILARLDEPVESRPGFVGLAGTMSDGLLEQLQKKCKSSLASNQMTRKSMGGTVFHGTGMLSSPFQVEIGGNAFEIRGKLGEGGYGAVFLGYDVDSVATAKTADKSADRDDVDSDDDEDDDEDDEADRRKQVAIKVEAPANRWEFHILSQLQLRLPVALQPSVIAARKLYCYSDASFLMLDLGEKGTLLDVVNHAVSAGVAAAGSSGADTTGGGAGLEEVLAMFFVTELLRVVLGMHHAGVIHGDLKIDNCLLRLGDVSPASAWSNLYARDGSAGWASKGLTLIDFGRAIDLTAFDDPSQAFVADWDTDAKDCLEMRRGESFTFETDWFGVAAIAHCLLFGRYMDLTHDNHVYKLTSPMKRYWQSELWNSLFHICLNPKPRSADGQPEALDKTAVLAQLESCLDNMHAWLEANSNKGGKNLKGLLRKLEIWAMKQGH
ncbi:mitotic checkpoint serine/threonine protein kinase [Moesziomyces antarcticus T-34]|uniref:Mitotic checkpoint serine/threonine protein kinase n=1 Tax=Pseudozyma antarctica (strain T-34) TaxID=1151754 RepID=M9M688_PSEA3|nr:mitotic checkpoint serine/threonine protein kinase [Moesziomyces antarcticus T-34]